MAKAALGFGPNRVRTLVSMGTDSFYMVIMEKIVLPLFLGYFHSILFILADNHDLHESSEEFEIRRDSTTDCGVSCPLASETTHRPGLTADHILSCP